MFNSNAAMIVTPGRSWRKFTGFWFPLGLIQSRKFSRSKP
jgi:hypothetical protein